MAIHEEDGQAAIHYAYRTIHGSAKCNAADARCFGGITRKIAYEDTEDKGIYFVLRYINYKTQPTRREPHIVKTSFYYITLILI